MRRERPVIFVDMDETLLHWFGGTHTVTRPGVRQALKHMMQVADLYVFSAGSPGYIEERMKETRLGGYFDGFISALTFPTFEWLGDRKWVLLDDHESLTALKAAMIGRRGTTIAVEPFEGQPECSPLTAYVEAAIQAVR
jgi:hypothetical protein